MFAVSIFVYASRNEVFVKLFNGIILTLQVYHWSCFAFFRDEIECWYTCIACYFGVIGTKSRCNMYDTSTIFGSNVVAKYNSEGFAFHFYECISAVFALEYFFFVHLSIVVYECGGKFSYAFNGFNPFHKLFVVNIFEVGSHYFSHYTVRQNLIGGFISRHFSLFHFAFWLKVSR